MPVGIGATLREARNRRRIDLDQVEARTKIRVRYLRAIENEEWDVLPGETYTRSFIRTYATFLGLDGDRLADEHRRALAPAGPQAGRRVERRPRPVRVKSPRRRPSISLPSGVWVAVVSAILIAIVIVIGVAGRDDSGTPVGGSSHAGSAGHKQHHSQKVTEKHGVAVRLTARGEVWVCLLDGGGEPLVDGEILPTGDVRGPFRSGSFTMSFGNGEISMQVNGKATAIPDTSSPVGYALNSVGRLTPIPDEQRPTCT